MTAEDTRRETNVLISMLEVVALLTQLTILWVALRVRRSVSS
jgi:hypothetical protein